MKLKVTYANEVACMKTETVSIELKNLTPLSCAVKDAVAYFEHIILKIRDVKDDSAEPILQEKSAKFSQISTELETLNTDCMYGSTAKLEILHTASKELFTAENNADANFLDKYKVTASKYKNLSENNTSDSHLIESTFEVEKCENGIIIFHLNISLATFSLDVPYMNQNVGAVILDYKIAKDQVTGVNTNTVIGRPVLYETKKGDNELLWTGEFLCAPTTATMLLEYYGISTVGGGYQVGGDDRSPSEKLRSGLMAMIYKKNPSGSPWETADNVMNAMNEIYKKAIEKNINPIRIVPTIISLGNEDDFITHMNLMLPVLSHGNPIYASILGKHILVVCGAVISSNKKHIWAICNDPYGSLSDKESDYTVSEVYEAWYSGDDRPRNSSTRRTRNINNKTDIPEATMGRHVYYNEKTHTRGDDKKICVHLRFRHASNFMNIYDTTMTGTQFATKKLVQGKIL